MHYADRLWSDLAALQRPGEWSTHEALGVLRAAISDGVTNQEREAAVIAWVCRDLAPSLRSASELATLYAGVAADGRGEAIFRTGPAALCSGVYARLVDGIGTWQANRFLGLGCPWLVRQAEPGEQVVDLGCGAGVDVFVASRSVGCHGMVIGVDRRTHLLSVGFAHPRSWFLRADALRCPLPSRWATTVVANGLPPLLRSSTAAAVLNEAARILCSGGWLHLVVLVAGSDVPSESVDDLLLVNSVRVGKPLCAEYRSWLAAAGFGDLTVDFVESPFVDGFRAGPVSAVLIMGRRR